MIYVSFGFEKGGSTLTALLTREILERAGHPHLPFSAKDRNELKKDGSLNRQGDLVNNVNEWSQDVVDRLDQGVPIHRIVMFRTHAVPSDAIGKLIKSGRASCHVAIRDLRSVALSILDAANRREKAGRDRKGFIAGDVATTFARMQEHVDSMYQWLDMPGAMLLEYEETAFSPSFSITKICRHLGLDLPRSLHDEIFAAAAGNRSSKRNVAKPKRYVQEMSAEDQTLVLNRFAGFYRDFYPHTAVTVLEDESMGY